MIFRPLLPTFALAVASLVFAQEPASSVPLLQDGSPTVSAMIAEGIYAEQPVQDEREARMQWWREAKFGMFIHYGLYSGLAGEFMGQKGGAEWIQCNLNLDTESYAGEALPLFQPAADCTEEWAELAAQAGCSYVVLTTKHHDGFALWQTAQESGVPQPATAAPHLANTGPQEAAENKPMSVFSAHSALGRDLVREFVESARSRELYVGFYHSVIDWHHPAYDNTICPELCYPMGQSTWLQLRGIPRNQEAYKQYLHAQVRELLTNYGQVDIMWWDYSQGAAEGERAWGAPALMQMCRELQPGIIMNNRLYSFAGLDPESDKAAFDLSRGDFTTPEKHIPEAQPSSMDWEACVTVGSNWGYNRHDTELKTPAAIIRHLQECVARGGNLLLNINPMADGRVPEGVADCFRRIGAWMDVNGEAIYASHAMPQITLPEGNLCTQVDEDLYIFLPEHAPADGSDYVLRLHARQIDAVRPAILGQPGCKVKMKLVEEQTEGRDEPMAYLCITIPATVWQDAVEGLPVLLLAADY